MSFYYKPEWCLYAAVEVERNQAAKKRFVDEYESNICYRKEAKKLLEEAREENAPLNAAFDRYSEGARQNILRYTIACRTGAADGRRAELLKNPEYKAVLDKYR